MNEDTGKMKRFDEMTEEEKLGGKFFEIPEKMPISRIKELSRSETKRKEYMERVRNKDIQHRGLTPPEGG